MLLNEFEDDIMNAMKLHPFYCEKHDAIKCDICRLEKEVSELKSEINKLSPEYKKALKKLSKRERDILGV